MLVIWYTSGKLRCFEPLCFKALCHGKFLIFKVRANFVWPWNENVRTTQKHQTNGNRAIWLVYRTDTNARGFWLVKRTLGLKNFMPENFLEINWYFALTSYCNSIDQSNNAFSILGVLWRKTKRPCFDLFIHWLITLNKTFFQCHTKIALTRSDVELKILTYCSQSSFVIIAGTLKARYQTILSKEKQSIIYIFYLFLTTHGCNLKKLAQFFKVLSVSVHLKLERLSYDFEKWFR